MESPMPVQNNSLTFADLYSQLSLEQRLIIRGLSVFPGSEISVNAVTAITGNDLDTTGEDLDILAGLGFVESLPERRYKISHDVKNFTATDTIATSEAAIDALIDWYASSVDQADRMVFMGFHVLDFGFLKEPCNLPFTDQTDAVNWLRSEFTNIQLIQDLAAKRAKHGPVVVFGSAIRFMTTWSRSLWPDVIEILTLSVNASRLMKNITFETFLLCRRAAMYRRISSFDLAEADLDLALRLIEQNNDIVQKITALLYFAQLARARQQYDKAKNYLESALSDAIQTGQTLDETLSYCNLGEISAIQGDFSKALEYAEKDLALRRKLNLRVGEAYVLGNVAHAWQGLGEHKKAIETCMESLAIYQSFPEREKSQAQVLSILAASQQKLGLVSEAKQNLRKAIAICTELGDPEIEELTAQLAAIESE